MGNDKLVRLSDVTGLLRKIEKLYRETYVSNVRADMVAHCIDRIKTIPAVDAVEVRHGEWIERDVFPAKENVDMLQSAFCPNCKRYHTTPYSYYFTNYEYCPHCGARMDGRREDGVTK